MITVISACGTGESSSPSASTVKSSGLTLDSNWGGFAWQVAKGVDQTRFIPVQIQYPAKGFLAGSPISYTNSVADGVAKGKQLIASASQFVLVGYSQGAQIISILLQHLQSGDLTGYMSKMVAGVTFGNPMRQHDHSWPGDPTGPTGQGINSDGLLTNTPANWWDMTNTYDLAGNIPTGASGSIIKDIWNAAGALNLMSVPQIINAINAVANGVTDATGDIIAGLLSNPLEEGADLTNAIAFLANAALDAGTLGHTCFGTAHVGSTGLTFVQMAVNYLDSFA